MKTKCRAMVLVSPERMEMQTFDLPETGDQDGLLELELCGVCEIEGESPLKVVLDPKG